MFSHIDEVPSRINSTPPALTKIENNLWFEGVVSSNREQIPLFSYMKSIRTTSELNNSSEWFVFTRKTRP